MYRLLLLDDEEIVTRSIQKVFQLQEFGFEVAGAFSNPVKALEQVGQLKPDLIITDVKMPQMDGLEFSSRVKEILPDVEIVILSGYGDFSYAQTAVKLGVSDYLLKPIKKDDFKNMLVRMRQKIEEKQSRQNYYNSLRKVLQNSFSELKNRFFLMLAEDGVYDENLYHMLREQKKDEILDAVFILIRVDIYQISAVHDYMSEIGKLTQQMEDALSGYGNVDDFLSDESLYFYLYYVKKEDEDHVRHTVHEILDKKKREGMRFSVGISHIRQGLKELFDARNDCVGQIYLAEANLAETPEISSVRNQEMAVNIPYREMESLFQEISLSNEQGIKDMLDKIYQVPAQNLHVLYRDYFFSITFLILLRIYQMQNKYGADHDIVETRFLDLRYLRKEYPVLEKQRELVEEKALQIYELISKQKIAAPSKMIRAALDYIDLHFNENISLQDVADNINISKNYLCDIFKKELGVTFINYVTNLRIEKAKEYLTNTDMKMYEVSYAVGYNDYAYFSQIFKKYTGTTLSAYRRKL